MNRLVALCFLFALAACAPKPESPDYREFEIESLQALMEQGDLTSEQLTRFYLERIEAVDRNGPGLNSIIEVNAEALEIARALDEERSTSGPRGPMHGIPVVLKANIDTADQMETTAGSLALAGHRPSADAFHVARLRETGAVILAKANLSEWANFRSTKSSSGWSSIGGQTNNPYDVRRNPCGSSSGSAVSVAASLTSVAVGTETDGSVVCPASINGIVGIKPTLGLVSRSGIVPIAHSQDTAGPMGRSVKDAAILLNAMVGRDDNDVLADTFPDEVPNFAAGLTWDALQGARIGVIRNYSGVGSDARVDAMFDQSVEQFRALGAEIVDAIEIDTDGLRDAEFEVLLYEFKTDLNAYLSQSGAPVSTLADIIDFNTVNAHRVMPIFQQEIMEVAEEKGPLTDPEYLEALATSKRIAQEGIDKTMAEHDLDALIAPTEAPAWLTDHVHGDNFPGVTSSSYAAVSGYPSITVPAGYISALPVGISLIGEAFSDARLIRYAYAFEQGTRVRRPPPID
jgi:amidase